VRHRARLESHGNAQFSDKFCRLFWIVYVYEGDFAAELSFNRPSGITDLEEFVPYPSEPTPGGMDVEVNESSKGMDDGESASPRNETPYLDFEAFQISTNSAIRRFLNRISAVVYDPKEAWRKHNPVSYGQWLLKINSELEAHHQAIHSNLPRFLLSTTSSDEWSRVSHSTCLQRDEKRAMNHDWNATRLAGRFHAGLYVIHRPFIEFVLVNPSQYEAHPLRAELLDKCRLCLAGCAGFIKVFFTSQANCATNLFATGMA